MSVIDVCLILIGVSFAGAMVRIARGPSLADRAVASDVALFCVVNALVLLAIRNGADAFVDVAVVATMLGFLATISLARLLHRGGKDR